MNVIIFQSLDSHGTLPVTVNIHDICIFILSKNAFQIESSIACNCDKLSICPLAVHAHGMLLNCIALMKDSVHSKNGFHIYKTLPSIYMYNLLNTEVVVKI